MHKPAIREQILMAVQTLQVLKVEQLAQAEARDMIYKVVRAPQVEALMEKPRQAKQCPAKVQPHMTAVQAPTTARYLEQA